MTQSVHLLVDVGNSRIKWNCLTAPDTDFHHPTHAFSWTVEELPALLDQHWEPLQEFVADVFVSNVAGENAKKIISQWCLDHWNVQTQFASTTQEFGSIKNGYDNHEELGVDRWLAVIGAQHLYPANTNVIIDCGSATTVDTVLPTGEHKGGPILSDRKALLEGLLSNTELSTSLSKEGVTLGDLERDGEPAQVFVKNTKNAILSGAKFATSNAVKQIVNQIEAELSSSTDIKLIATGGAAQNLMTLSTLSTRKNYNFEPDLVLKGLACYYGVYDFS